ncbi:hypothetical protein BU24DRAFT_458720 [Aaosphaeria arxii CBS 175.79]|uniref:Large ribosomal subunit protein uL23m n=1 Tax=Aaosphaeria arxii CBS 175.79 TaxID=1450172 RepID=A0A6A5Y293_9PLEO|nr:uncharacterized protein BU24DRAFT_458720 [Aaosphaeria arxii CBS 175.79]KAF2019001.1 hypothetical protein BU24DRAFT_458720 [Aaosphaeria arxii CBS 175.79]
MDLPSKIVRFGTKEIYLPKFTVALMRTPKLSPYHAKFQVPLNFSKLDLRDYLFHAYNVRALSIRSFVKQEPVRDHESAPRQFFRPEAKKYMTIEMDKPFVWPATPESWEPWGRKQKRAQQEQVMDSMGAETPEGHRKEGEELRRQAQAVLGKRSGALKEWEKKRSSKTGDVDEPQFKIKV